MKKHAIAAIAFTTFFALVGCTTSTESQNELSAASEGAFPGDVAPKDTVVDNEKVQNFVGHSLFFRGVFGWAAWKCADLGQVAGTTQHVSLWYVTAQGTTSAQSYYGTCAFYSTDYERARYRQVSDTEMCAILPEGGSARFKIGEGVRNAYGSPKGC